MRTLLLFLLLVTANATFSQDEKQTYTWSNPASKEAPEEVKNYTWAAVPKFNDIPQEFLSYPAVVLKDYRLYDNRIGQYVYKAFVVKHVAIKILQTDGINDYNKVNINKKYVRDYRDLKARVIKSDGRIQELSKDRIIEKEESDDRQFVFEGVEKGDIIEYYYVIKDYPDFSGAEYFQRAIPVVEAKFQINLISQGSTHVYVFNGVNKTLAKGNYICTVANLPAYKEEENATNIANLAKLYYSVDNNIDYTWDTFYNSLNSYAAGTNAKGMVSDFIDLLKLDDVSVPLDDRLKKMDIYLKENIELAYQDNYKKVFETKKINPKMVLNLYKDVLDVLKVPYQFTASTDKFEDKFDTEKAVAGSLSEILIYIPETKKYLSPFYYWMPYGPPNSVCINNDAVYYSLGEKKKISHDFTKIGGVSMNDNIDATNSEITIDDDMETVSVRKQKTFTGYMGYYYRNKLKYVKEDKLNDFVKDVVINSVDADLKSEKLENQEYKFNYENDKPLTFDTELQIKESWVENAGKNYLVTIGKVLGKQSNLYQETERRYPIDISFPKKYIHAITFNIPKGYAVKKVDNLIFNKELKNEKGEVIGRFASDAKIENSTVKIAIEEFYNFTHLEKERYGEYRDLINTAFDFYKSSLILTKI